MLEDFPMEDAVIILRKKLQPEFVPPPVIRITSGGFGTPANPRIHPSRSLLELERHNHIVHILITCFIQIIII